MIMAVAAMMPLEGGMMMLLVELTLMTHSVPLTLMLLVEMTLRTHSVPLTLEAMVVNGVVPMVM